MKIRNYFFTLLYLATLFFTSCNTEATGPIIKECPDFIVEEGSISDETEYQIINAVIKNNFSDFPLVQIINIPQDLIVGNTTAQAQEYLSAQGIELEDELLDKYVNLNQSEEKWKNSFKEGALKSEEEKRCFYADNEFPCESYQNKYPNGRGFLNFTRPAFFEEQKAIVEYLEDHCNGIRGVFVILKFEEGNWVVEKFFTTIIS